MVDLLTLDGCGKYIFIVNLSKSMIPNLEKFDTYIAIIVLNLK